MPGDRPLYVGRTRELADVWSIVDQAVGGAAGALLVSGDAGSGKTALVAQGLRGRDDVFVLRSTCLRMRTITIPLAPLTSALRRLPAGLPPAPMLLDGERATNLAPTRLDAWLDDVCDLRPTVLVVDDLQWADDHTLDALTYALGGRPERRLAVLLTLRRSMVADGDSLHAWLADVLRLPNFGRLDLAPLTAAETAEQVDDLLGGPSHASLVAEVQQRTRGNPYHNRLLVTGLSPATRNLPTAMPEDLRGALLADWHRLGPAARRLTSVLAVGERPLGMTELAKLLLDGEPDLAVAEAVGDAVDHHVLEIAADGTAWFHHPLQAEVVAAQLSAEDRRRWHEIYARRLASTLSRRPSAESLIRLADHHRFAGHPESAVTVGLAAADAAAETGARREAIRILLATIDLLPLLDPAPDRALLLRRVRRLAVAAGDVTAERAAIDDLLQIVDAEVAPREVSELRVRRVQLRQVLAEDFAPADEIDDVVALGSRAPDSWEYAYALAEQARIGVWRDDPVARQRAEHALDLALRAQSPRALSYALTTCAMAELAAGARERAVDLARRGRAAAVEAVDFWAFVYAVAWEANATEIWSSAAYAEVVHSARQQAISLAAPPLWVRNLAVLEVAPALAVGQVSTCRGLLRTLLGGGLLPAADVQSRLVAIRLAVQQGRPEDARAHLARAQEICDRLPRFIGWEFVPVVVELEVETDHPETAARMALDTLRSGSPPPVMCEWLVPQAARALADLLLARPPGPSAGWAATELEWLTTTFPRPGTPPAAGRPSVVIDGVVSTPYYRRQIDAFGLWYAAECSRAAAGPDHADAWDRAARALSAAVLPWEAAYAGWRAAEACLLQAHPDRHEAADWLRRTAAGCAELEARPLLERVQRLARAARIPLTTPTRAVRPLGLTRRESEILAHLVAGRTYREIAEALVISEKTVSSHLSAMFRKTGTANRVELAQRAGAEPAPPAPV